MAVERKTKSRRKLDELQEKPTKEEYAVAKFLRFGVPVREGRLVGMTVQCFFANKAIDALLESKWSAAKQKKDPLFTNRPSCVSYCNRLLQKGLFHRAEKVQRSKDRDKSKKKKKIKEGEKEEESAEEQVKERKGKKDKKGKKDTDVEKTEEEEKKEDGDKKEEKKPEKEEEKKKKEKKLKLNMHDDQRFFDGEEVYVWIYDPVPLKTFLIGLLMVFGAIALCLFPLWPEEVRVGVYYISLAAASFVGFILILVVVRIVLFCFVWVFTLGKHHFWFLPNLTEDVGFFDSFKPLYKHDCMTKNTADDKTKEKKSKETKKEIEAKKEEKKEEVEKDENSGSDKSENGEFELVDKEELGEGTEGDAGEGSGDNVEGEGEGEEEEEEEGEEDEENELDEEDSEEDTTETKKEK